MRKIPNSGLEIVREGSQAHVLIYFKGEPPTNETILAPLRLLAAKMHDKIHASYPPQPMLRFTLEVQDVQY